VAVQFDRIDILVASAGITGPNETAREYPLDAWNKLLRINLDGVMHCCRAAVPHMPKPGYGRLDRRQGRQCASLGTMTAVDQSRQMRNAE